MPVYLEKWRPIAAVAVTAFLMACSAGNSQSSDAQALDLIEWSKRNPPVTEDTWRGVSKLLCKPTLLDVCDDSECRSQKIGSEVPVVVTWQPDTGEYRRCNSTGQDCDTYQPQVSYSGSFANVVLPANGLMFRVTASGEYREIANLMTDTLVYRGQCTVN
jgi:hypothetical protein